MSILIEDSPRNLNGWIVDAHKAGISAGAVMTPFASPWLHIPSPGRKHGLKNRVDALHAKNVPVWFDPTTHALQMGGVGDFRFYDEYDLWTSVRGELTNSRAVKDHVERVFAIQDELRVPRLAPTHLLHTGLSTTSQLALEIAQEAILQDPQCWLSVAGTAPFWASGAALDAHIGALAQLDPRGWFLTVARPVMTMPADSESEEVHGLCRTARAFSEDGVKVHISHGDLAALPAVAAGATTVGSGWDKRQRLCSFSDYAARGEPTSGGAWLERSTLRRLLGSITKNEAAILANRDPARVITLGGLPPAPGPKEAFMHHLDQLASIITALRANGDPRVRANSLQSLYIAANIEWPAVQGITNCDPGAAGWISPFAKGLDLYRVTEGW
jgi:hypothetical protein